MTHSPRRNDFISAQVRLVVAVNAATVRPWYVRDPPVPAAWPAARPLDLLTFFRVPACCCWSALVPAVQVHDELLAVSLGFQ
jgi:hypothetical protein